MRRSWRARLVMGVVALASLGLAGAANADLGWGPAWFPVTRSVWEAHSLGRDRSVELRMEGSTILWRVEFFTDRNEVFRAQEGSISLEVPTRCERPGVYAGRSVDASARGRLTRLGKSGRELYHLRTRAEVGDVVSRLRSSEANGRRPLPEPHYPRECEAIRRHCTDEEAPRRAPVLTPVWRDQGGSYDGLAPSTRRSVPCKEVDRRIESCLENERRADVRHQEALEQYEKSWSCVAVAFATRGTDDGSVDIEVVSADGTSWGGAHASIDRLVDPSAWLYSPLTVVADIPIMAVHNTMLALFILITIPGA